jgi:hypothetical protein
VADVFDSVSAWLTVPDVAETLGVSPGRVRRYIEEHTLIAVKRDGVFKIPAETIQDNEPLPSLKGTILVLIDSGFDVLGATEWLYTLNDELGRKPIESLVMGRKAEVRRVAQALAF